MAEGNNAYWHKMMELAEGNHQVALFFLGWLSQDIPEARIRQSMIVLRDVLAISKVVDEVEMLDALLNRFRPQDD